MFNRPDAPMGARCPKPWAPLFGLMAGMLLGGLSLAGLGLMLENELMLFILVINGLVAGSLAGYHLTRQLFYPAA